MRYLKTNLHRAGTLADWEQVPIEKRNPWQRVAASTKGILTPANVTSILGAALVGLGLWYLYTDDLAWGFVCIAVGRLADILDGAVAQATGTKSSVGEALDAGLDKVIVIAALVVFLVTGIVPVLAAVLIGVRNIINMGLGLLGKAKQRPMHPTRAGKLAATAEWAAILLFILAGFFGAQGWAAAEIATFVTAYILLAFAMTLGLVAIKEYATAAVGKQ